MRNLHLVITFVTLCSLSTFAQTPEVPPAATETVAAPTPAPTPLPLESKVQTPVIAQPSARSKGPATLNNKGEFTRPLLFAPSDNGLSIDNPQLKWEMVKGEKINLNGLKIDAGALDAQFEEINRSDLPVRYDRAVSDQTALLVFFSWPEVLARVGTVSIENLNGDVKWSKPYSEEERNSWDSIREDLNKSTPKVMQDRTKVPWAWFDVPKGPLDFLRKGGIYRMCLTQTAEAGALVKICAKPLRVGVLKGHLATKPLVHPGHQANVFFDGKSIGESGVVNFPADRLANLKVEFANESFIEFSTKPADPELLDAIESDNGQNIILTGHGAKPLDQAKVISKPDENFWAATGFKQETIWQVSIPIEAPTVRILGAFNIPFTMLFTHDRLPRETDRIYIDQTRSSGTYSDAPVIKGLTPTAGVVGSSERKARMTDIYHFDWTFAAPTKGKKNHAHIKVRSRKTKQVWVAQHDLYRSFPYEASARLTGIAASTGSFVLLGEVAAAGWFESVFGAQDELFSKQRWGIATRYFRSLTPLTTTSGTSITDFSVANVDLKYNFLPGIWHYDELLGAILSVEHITIAGQMVDLGGAGLYWARTMPKIFNDLFNIAPVFAFPKYVDMEFIYYPYAVTAGYTAGSSYALNFHGRIFWTERFYGELGFGLRNYEFTIPGRTVPIGLTTAYGNGGLGLIF